MHLGRPDGHQPMQLVSQFLRNWWGYGEMVKMVISHAIGFLTGNDILPARHDVPPTGSAWTIRHLAPGYGFKAALIWGLPVTYPIRRLRCVYIASNRMISERIRLRGIFIYIPGQIIYLAFKMVKYGLQGKINRI